MYVCTLQYTTGRKVQLSRGPVGTYLAISKLANIHVHIFDIYMHIQHTYIFMFDYIPRISESLINQRLQRTSEITRPFLNKSARFNASSRLKTLRIFSKCMIQKVAIPKELESIKRTASQTQPLPNSKIGLT